MVKHGNEVNLEYSKQNIIDKINYFFGSNVVDNIVIKIFDNQEEISIAKIKTVTKNKFHINVNGIRNNDLKNSLIKFAKIYKNK